MLGRGGASALIACGLIALFVLPIATAPANEAGTCGRLLDTQVYKEPHERGAWTVLFEEQRLSATCEDARLARWVSVAVAAATLLLVAGATSRHKGMAVAVGAGLLALAAGVDGPIVPLGLAAAGAALSAFAQLRGRAAAPP